MVWEEDSSLFPGEGHEEFDHAPASIYIMQSGLSFFFLFLNIYYFYLLLLLQGKTKREVDMEGLGRGYDVILPVNQEK